MVDEAVPVLVDHVEGLLELLDLVLVEHGEDVGGCALSTFFRARAPGRLAARHPGGPLARPEIFCRLKKIFTTKKEHQRKKLSYPPLLANTAIKIL